MRVRAVDREGRVGSAGYGMMYHAGKKTGKTDNDDMIADIVRSVEERAEVLRAEREAVG